MKAFYEAIWLISVIGADRILVAGQPINYIYRYPPEYERFEGQCQKICEIEVKTLSKIGMSKVAK